MAECGYEWLGGGGGGVRPKETDQNKYTTFDLSLVLSFVFNYCSSSAGLK